MSLNVKVSGVWKDPMSVSTRVSGSWKTVQDIWVKVSGTWKLVWAYLSVTVSAGGQTVTPIGMTGTARYAQALTTAVTGGTAPYTYAWSKTGSATLSSPTGSTNSIEATFSDAFPDTSSGIVTCTVTDSLGLTATDATAYYLSS